MILGCGKGTYDGQEQACFRGVDQWDWEDTEEGEEVEGCWRDEDGEEACCAGHGGLVDGCWDGSGTCKGAKGVLMQ
jgi:hypothetical protein